MPARFTCRLLIVRTASGRIRVRYGCLGDKCERVLVLHGPEMLIPPDHEMTDKEFELWEYQLAYSAGYTSRASRNVSVDSPLVEAKRTYEDEIPVDSVKAVLFWEQPALGGQTLAVRVTNTWAKVIPRFSLSCEDGNETVGPGRGVSNRDERFKPLKPFMGDLHPLMSAEFVLRPEAFPLFRSRAASLSIEQYWIALLTDGYEFDRIPGELVAKFLAG
jgi:hypothetical protein